MPPDFPDILNMAVTPLGGSSSIEKEHRWADRVTSQAVMELVKLGPTVIRGNASEIMAVAGAAGVSTKGVDSTVEAEQALELGERLARERGCVVAISGATDLVR